MTITCDTSVLVPALASWHVAHASSRAALGEVRVIGAHVLLETYSVLTRLPGRQRIDARQAGAVVEALDWEVVSLAGPQHRALIADLARSGVSGGAVYDALVGATAAAHSLTLLTRDRRAQRTYDALGIPYAMQD